MGSFRSLTQTQEHTYAGSNSFINFSSKQCFPVCLARNILVRIKRINLRKSLHAKVIGIDNLKTSLHQHVEKFQPKI